MSSTRHLEDVAGARLRLVVHHRDSSDEEEILL
jgi:hypothetical protein